MSVVDVIKPGIGKYILMFVVYLVGHMIIGHYMEKAKKEFQESQTSETLANYKKLNIAFKWFPALAVVLIVVSLMF